MQIINLLKENFIIIYFIISFIVLHYWCLTLPPLDSIKDPDEYSNRIRKGLFLFFFWPIYWLFENET